MRVCAGRQVQAGRKEKEKQAKAKRVACRQVAKKK